MVMLDWSANLTTFLLVRKVSVPKPLASVQLLLTVYECYISVEEPW